ncbi:MAG: hypothetical protein MRJ68_17560 [Nitrospira sp.]|nr:hypothetical protein [Nitrospira sp.]
MEHLDIPSWRILLEQDLHKDAYHVEVNPDSKRDSNLEVDLIIDTASSACCEFSIFKKTSTGSSSATTKSTGKLIGDMIRLSLESVLSNRWAYLICITDRSMLGNQLQSKLLPVFPSDYIIDEKKLTELKNVETVWKEGKINRFESSFLRLGGTLHATIVHNKPLQNVNGDEIRLIVWSVTLSST